MIECVYINDIMKNPAICSRNSAQIAIENIDTIQVINHNLIYGYNGAADCIYGSDSVVGDPVFVDKGRRQKIKVQRQKSR